jgi:hypothetical protein
VRKFKIQLQQHVSDGLWRWEIRDDRGQIIIQRSTGGFPLEPDARADAEDAARYLATVGHGKTVTYDYEVPE